MADVANEILFFIYCRIMCSRFGTTTIVINSGDGNRIEPYTELADV